MIGSESDIGDYAFDIYWGYVKGIVSNYLTDCAIKTRILQDYLTENKAKLDLAKIDVEARKNIDIGIIHEGDFELSLRESCNNIIHATKSIPSWSEKPVAGNVFKYWNGFFALYGSKGNQKWQFELNVRNWAKAMIQFHDMISSSEESFYMGQDW